MSREEWLTARRKLLENEKALTRARDELCVQRRALPWVRIEKEYIFDGPAGAMTLADLFDGRSQLYVQHFMFDPTWSEGCIGCSFGADHVDAARQHFEHNDLSFAAVSRAPVAQLEAYRKRMGWSFRWVSSLHCDFNYDFDVSFRPEDAAAGRAMYNFAAGPVEGGEASGCSVFAREETGAVFYTYSACGRGDEGTLGAYSFLDLTPKGRNENGPHHNLMDGVRRHDTYDTAKSGGCCSS